MIEQVLIKIHHSITVLLDFGRQDDRVFDRSFPTPLLEFGIAGAEIFRRGDPRLGLEIDIPTGYLVARKSNLVTEPFACHKDRHLDTQTNLGMEKGTSMIVRSQVPDKFFVACREFS
jgi:hypothetical protein